MSNTFTQADDVTLESPSGQQTVLWQVEIYPLDGLPDRLAADVIDGAAFLSLPDSLQVDSARGFLVQGQLDYSQIESLARNLLVDPVVERAEIAPCGEIPTTESHQDLSSVYVLPQPGVTDPQAESALCAMRATGAAVEAVRTFRRYFISDLTGEQFARLADKLLCNDSIELIEHGTLEIDRIGLGRETPFELKQVDLCEADDDRLIAISKQWQLSLTLVEMQTIQAHFKSLEREPTDIELETIAQTWSEHCSHKTLAGRVEYTDDSGTRNFDNMLKETIFAATVDIRQSLGENDWCVSVFKDNAGIVRFNDDFNVAFKVETHNRPSALEPYGGANTGIGGVIRDTLGTGLGAKPVCNTDVFCFASPETDFADLPPGVMHPAMIMKGVVAGVRDYGNRMGIPTVNGAVYFDQRYIGNPLVFCGNVGLIPCDKSEKEPQPNDLIVTIGGRTGRDGIHGATFSSAELTEESDVTSGGAVQIGNAITEKMVMDVLLAARDRNLYSAVTDCGAGGFSSAVGEMGEEIGAEVWLDKAPLKYDGLTYTEIWISEAQERMVFAVPEDKWDEFRELCESESVEATVIGRYTPTGNLTLKYKDTVVGELSMEFMHDGRPPVVRKAEFKAPVTEEVTDYTPRPNANGWTNDLRSILGSLNVASKHWIIRQYDHEVQGGSVIKPLVGVHNDGPGDAAVVRPVLDSRRGLAISCGMNPHYGDIDPYHMATSSIDEAIRNCVAVGADPSRIAILDNFCWGYTDRPETLGTLVRAALGCHDLSIVMQTPFISGKDSLNNEFSYTDENGDRQTISIPSTLLISAMGQVPDVANCVTMDLKKAGNLLYQVGVTGNHLGGSHWSLVSGATGGHVPTVDAELASKTFATLHTALSSGLVRSCHDLSEGGLAAAVAEMAFAGDLGATISLDEINADDTGSDPVLIKLFSESNTRFVVEVEPEKQKAFESAMNGIELARLGQVVEIDRLEISDSGNLCIESDLASLKAAWQNPLDWN